ncbi:30S ribosomal protein S20 [Bacillus horti]|uniref:Small ribosomal subunit protein bS20 n=1 Tax=Caldalkalibacillus horti TaxID=77523 RepID=A0ABT9VT10_9BACI|nr:30S ribosomal protein S20 [Bacillus horti]MDQ0164114.1 small subunit ribosomal protein S20 [Bacillus horti]
MPNIKSAIKRVKTNNKKRLHNATQKSALRTAIKSFETLVEQNNVEAASSALVVATRKLDKAAAKGLIHKNAASRQKSRLTKKLNSITA